MSDDAHILSVSELTQHVKLVLEGSFPSVWVCGEVTDLGRPRSGHIYLTLKDEAAQVRAVAWRNTASRLQFDLQDGMEVVCQGELNVYPPRGSYQLIIRQIEPRGVGALEIALRQLRAKLAAEGLFDAEHKKPLPEIPRRIAFVTSPTGAAIHDFLEVLRRRWQGTDVLIIPSRVQGEGAAAELARGVRQANQLATPPDVIVIGRGGGSLEDLWCFNEEPVVRAVFESQIPVMSAVGHEIDVTLCDLVADVRALTPSEAAERLVPNREEVLSGLKSLQSRMTAALRTKAAAARSRVDALAQRRVLSRPLEIVQDLAQRLDELERRAALAMRHCHANGDRQIAAIAAQLEALSPLSTLARGYSLTELAETGELLRSAEQVQDKQLLRTRLANGEVYSRVDNAAARVNQESDDHDE